MTIWQLNSSKICCEFLFIYKYSEKCCVRIIALTYMPFASLNLDINFNKSPHNIFHNLFLKYWGDKFLMKNDNVMLNIGFM